MRKIKTSSHYANTLEKLYFIFYGVYKTKTILTHSKLRGDNDIFF